MVSGSAKRAALLFSFAVAPLGVQRGFANQTKAPLIMLDMFNLAADLIPIANNARAFQDSKNAPKISKQIHDLKLTVEAVNRDKIHLSVDPFNKLLLSSLAEDLQEASVLFDKGDKETARAIVRTVPGYCIGCHTSSPNGPKAFPANLFAKVSSLPHLDQANFLAATRQYKEAINQYEAALTDHRLAKENPEDWETGVKRLLVIIIRVKDDPPLALELISRLREEKSISPKLMAASAIWRSSVVQWRKEKAPLPYSRAEQLSLAKALIEKAQPVVVSSGRPAALIEYLRASRLLNQVLDAPEADSLFREGLWFAGQVAEEIDEISPEPLAPRYYEACITYQPHTPTARKCLERWKVVKNGQNLGKLESLAR